MASPLARSGPVRDPRGDMSTTAWAAYDRIATPHDPRHPIAGTGYAPELLKLLRWLYYTPGLSSATDGNYSGKSGAARAARAHEVSTDVMAFRLKTLRDIGMIERLPTGGWRLTGAGHELRTLIDMEGIV